MALSVKHLLGIKELNTQDIEQIFQTADNFKQVLQRPIKKVPTLRDTTVANIFFENRLLSDVSSYDNKYAFLILNIDKYI
jgi:aspartate carbamoyltransferase catalytic subunit